MSGGPFNALTPLTTPTYDGSGEATHPDVIDFGSDAASPTGQRYVMVLTPYPAGNDAYENPSLLHSSDNVTWTVPDGLTNPIDATPAGGYNADTDLCWDGSTLYLIYLGFDGTNKQVVMRTSTDGVAWGAEQVMWTTVVATENPVSPTIVEEADGSWTMWYIDQADVPNTLNRRTAASPVGPWSAEQVVSFTGCPTTHEPWHIDVIRDGSLYRMLVNDTRLGINGQGGRLLLGSSSDGVSWRFSDPVLDISAQRWDNERIYRSSGVIDGDSLHVWYGAVSQANAWRIGYTTLPMSAFPDPPT